MSTHDVSMDDLVDWWRGWLVLNSVVLDLVHQLYQFDAWDVKAGGALHIFVVGPNI